MHYFNKLEVWKKARSFTKQIYTITKDFPSFERFGLSSQMQRAVISISSNIAEGAGRNSKNEYIHFLNITTGSAFELETQINLAKDLEYISEEKETELISEIHSIQKMLFRLIQSINK